MTPAENAATDDKGFSEETCVRCGWRMGSPALNCSNDNTPHVFPSQAALLAKAEAAEEGWRRADGMARAPYGEFEAMRAERDAAVRAADEWQEKAHGWRLIAEDADGVLFVKRAEAAERAAEQAQEALREYANPDNWDLADGPPFVWVKDSDPPRIARAALTGEGTG